MGASAPAPARAGSRLTVEDWIDAGFAVIAQDGMRSVKIDSLCARLGVTKGSFYWHFSDIGAYFRALAEAWGEAQRASRASLEGASALPPHERLSAMMRHLTSPRQWMLERAMREWARWDPDGGGGGTRVGPVGVLRGAAGVQGGGLLPAGGHHQGARGVRRGRRVHPSRREPPSRR